jgi:hypothetical protein
MSIVIPQPFFCFLRRKLVEKRSLPLFREKAWQKASPVLRTKKLVGGFAKIGWLITGQFIVCRSVISQRGSKDDPYSTGR